MRDKILHFAVSALIVITIGKFAPWWLAATVALLCGAGKEIYDIKHGVPSWLDMSVDFLGILYGLAINLDWALLFGLSEI